MIFIFLLNSLNCNNKVIGYKMYEYSDVLLMYEEYSN